jgi:gas vesicle protein
MSHDKNTNNANMVLISLFTGLAIGATLGILFAPKSGREIRIDLKKDGRRLVETGKKNVSDVVEKTKDLVEEGKERVEKIKDIAR